VDSFKRSGKAQFGETAKSPAISIIQDLSDIILDIQFIEFDFYQFLKEFWL